MTILQQIADLGQRVVDFGTAMKSATTRKRQSASLADDTVLVGGMDKTQLAAAVAKTGSDHIAAHGNPHGDTPASLGIYGAAELATLTAGLVPSGVLPISRFGTLDYLPAGVAGGFEGGTTINSIVQAAMIVENDGTLTYLRNGTDGASHGVYYAYMRNAGIGGLVQPSRTTRRYRPSFVPAGQEIAYICGGSDSALMGKFMDANQVEQPELFIALTGNTLDDSKHVGCKLQVSTLTTRGTWAYGRAILVGTTVYIFIPVGRAGGTVGFEVWTVPKASIVAGATVIPTQVTGISTDGYSGTRSASLIQVADMSISYNAADKPLVLADAGVTANVFHYFDQQLFVEANAAGVMRIKALSSSYMSAVSISGRGYISFSLTYNPATKKAIVDGDTLTQTRYINRGTYIQAVGPIYADDAGSVTDGAFAYGNMTVSSCLSSAGKQYQIIQAQGVDNVYYSRCSFDPALSKFEALRRGVTFTNLEGFMISPSFGSAIASALDGATALSDTRLTVYSTGRNKAGVTTESLAYTDLQGSVDGYTHKSLYNGTYLGYKPSANRGFIADLGIDANNHAGKVVEVNGAIMHVSGTHFNQLLLLAGPANILPDMTSNGAVSVSQTVINAIAADMKTKVQASTGLTVSKIVVELIVPQLNMPPFAVATTLTSNGQFHVSLAPVTITGGSKSSAITAVTVAPLARIERALNDGYVGQDLVSLYYWLLTMGSVNIYETSTGFLIGMNVPTGLSFVGDTVTPNLHFRYDKATAKFVFNVAMIQGVGHSRYNGYSYYASTSLGFGMIYSQIGSGGPNDELTKVVFIPMAKTDAAFDSWPGITGDKSTWRVLASQEVAQEWVTYFTEETPLLMNGRYYTLPPATFNLTTVTADPSNKTFYVYVVVTGTAGATTGEYQLSLTERAESNVQMFVGTIVTGATKIASVNVAKVTRVDLFRLSQSPVGSAIPVSTGTPTATSPLTWI